MKTQKLIFKTALLLLALSMPATAIVQLPSLPAPSKAKVAKIPQGGIALANNILRVDITKEGWKMMAQGSKEVVEGIPFAVTLKGGKVLNFADFKVSAPVSKALPAIPKSPRLSERVAGDSVVLVCTNEASGITVLWRGVLREGSHYFRQEMVVQSKKPAEIESITPLLVEIPNAKLSGYTAGSLALSDVFFAGVEMPTVDLKVQEASSEGKASHVEAKWARDITLEGADKWKISSVVGLVAPDQARRSFLAYIERERALPYRPFIHYNSWYELNINRNDSPDPLKRMSEKQCVDVINVWNTELFQKRQTNIEAFVWDDGWDEFKSLWEFHVGFPKGFQNLDKLSAKQNAGTGAWLSPWGGYGGSKSQRVENWNNTREPKINEFKLGMPTYYKAFRDRCLQMIKDYDMRYFKFDGIGAGTFATGPGQGAGAKDLDGLLRLTQELRTARPNIFINATVGTWASPFWFQYVDSIWRQGDDWSALGEGNERERWITYRDEMIYRRFVEKSPLFPINSLMFHGLIVGDVGPPHAMPNDLEGIKHEIRCAFGCGSALQELYVSSHLMTPEAWDELAKGIKWMRANIDVLDDVHWVGPVPYDKESKVSNIYGWAAWNPQKGVLTLRNPSPEKKTYTTTLRKALDIPAEVKGTYSMKNAYDDQRDIVGKKALDIDEEITFALDPFEVFVWDLRPVVKK